VLLEHLQRWRGITPAPPITFPTVDIYAPSEAVEEGASEPQPSLPPHLLELPGMSNLPPGFDPERFFQD
jgi:hypothetical protein